MSTLNFGSHHAMYKYIGHQYSVIFGMLLSVWSSTFSVYFYSATSIIRTPLATALMLAYRLSEIVRITSFLTGYMIPSHY